jgi:hypothetical protein
VPKRFAALILTFCALSGGTRAADDAAGDLAAGFVNPSESARPWVYWFWLNGNVTKDGITADLEAMKQVGIGGTLWMWGGGSDLGEAAKKPVALLSPQWWEIMRHTIQEADRLGLKINLANGSGWSHSGGPWITPQHSMRRLELIREIRLQGTCRQEIVFPPGDSLVGVLAYSVKSRDKDSKGTLDSRSVVDLTDKVDASRRFLWDVPPGEWTVQVLGHVSTGDRPHPILNEEGGWECDKLSTEAVEEN